MAQSGKKPQDSDSNSDPKHSTTWNALTFRCWCGTATSPTESVRRPSEFTPRSGSRNEDDCLATRLLRNTRSRPNRLARRDPRAVPRTGAGASPRPISGCGGRSKLAEEAFQGITEAFNVLYNPERRRLHDLELTGPESEAAPQVQDQRQLVKVYLSRGIKAYKERNFRSSGRELRSGDEAGPKRRTGLVLLGFDLLSEPALAIARPHCGRGGL